MTLNKAALAIDGAIVNSALVRTEAYANSSGQEGIITKGDLKVTQLDVAGNGLKISDGAALVLNRYQTSPNQMYTIANSGSHTVGAASMPVANAAQQTYIVAIAIGDSEFSQSGHPFMLASDPPVGQESTFEYVRPVVVLESQFNSRAYPAVPLARIVIPANTTTITNAMITDLRKLARPRTRLEVAHTPGPGTVNTLNGGSGGTPGVYERWPNVPVMTVEIPDWAVKAKIMGFVEGTKLSKAGFGKLRGYIEGTSLVTSLTELNEADFAAADRRAYNFAGEITLTSAVRGTTKTFSVEATPDNAASKGFLTADSKTSVAIQVYFEEQPT